MTCPSVLRWPTSRSARRWACGSPSRF
jgi:hypothetical protein